MTAEPWKLSKAEVRKLVKSLGDIATVLRTADPKMKDEVYAELGISITYKPDNRIVIAEARPACATARVGGGT